MSTLCFVGMSGAGKSYWAKRLAATGFLRHDCDTLIAQALGSIVAPELDEEPVHALGRWMGMPWTEGFAEREQRYLALEDRVTQEALRQSGAGDHIVDTTGSVIYTPGAQALRQQCRVVYLRVDEARQGAMLERYLTEPKPVVWGDAYAPRAGETSRQTLERCYPELLRFRDARYQALAHVVLDAAALESAPPDVAELLRRIGL